MSNTPTQKILMEDRPVRQHQLPHLTEPAHWGVFFNRHLVWALTIIVLLPGCLMWMLASNTQVEQSHSATLIEQSRCLPEQSEMLCITLSPTQPVTARRDHTIRLRVEFENPSTFTRTSRDVHAIPLTEHNGLPTRSFNQPLYRAVLASPASQPHIKKLLVISETSTAWQRFCEWFSARLPITE
ncbi:hypothetical protein [Cellvibrio fontiphilus]|uniref:Uncharacterized protein n=1 Tax=Cellvibrio fontiphilus TaxID=1815559 RepID=A0ABV7FIY8_9GAMM